MSGSTLELVGLRKHYPGTDRAAVEDVSLTLPAGEMIALLGPSGCGKTTTLRMISGLVEPTAGQIMVGARDITHTPVHRREMGMVFQSYALFPHLSVSKNVAYGLSTRRVGKSERTERVQEALRLVGLESLADRRPRQLSGGQQQRVALARALVVQPTLLLLDEPLSNLDAKLRDSMRDEIRSLQQTLGITTVFVTHDQDEALATADKIAIMDLGRVQQVGTPRDIYEHPANEFVARFIGRGNYFTGTVASHDPEDDNRLEVEVPGLGRLRCSPGRSRPDVGEALLVLIRPHRIQLQRAPLGNDVPSALPGVIAEGTYTGDAVSLTVHIRDHALRVEVPTSGVAPLAQGDRVNVMLRDHAALALPLSRDQPTATGAL